MNKYQRLVDAAEVRELPDTTTGGKVHCALYGNRHSRRAYVQLLPSFANLSNRDRVAQGAALADASGLKVLQIAHPGFRGSSMRPSHVRGGMTGNFTPQARTIDAVIRKHLPLGDVQPEDAIVIGESLSSAVASKLGRLGLARHVLLIEAFALFKQSGYGIVKQLLGAEKRMFGERRKAIVQAATNGLVLPDAFVHTGGVVRSKLSVNPFIFLCMTTPGFGSDAVYKDLDEGMNTHPNLHISGSAAELSQVFPHDQAQAAYGSLRGIFGNERVAAMQTIPGEGHFTATADPEAFAELVMSQTLELAA